MGTDVTSMLHAITSSPARTAPGYFCAMPRNPDQIFRVTTTNALSFHGVRASGEICSNQPRLFVVAVLDFWFWHALRLFRPRRRQRTVNSHGLALSSVLSLSPSRLCF